MNERIIKLGLDSGMLNYIDHETPRVYFLCGHADEECLEKFAEMIVRECASVVSSVPPCHGDYRDQIEVGMRDYCARKVLEHFGVE